MIEINHLYFSYKKGQNVLEDLNLSLQAGKIYGLLGRNGAGKSSLLYNICGLLFPTQGNCLVLGETPEKRSVKFLQRVALLAEEVSVPNVTIKSYLKTYSPFYPDFNAEQFYHFLNEFQVDLTGRLHNMSLGQRKKVMISFALATSAKVLLMDEPTNGLDIPSKRQFRKIIAGAMQEDQVIIISTHQVKDLDSLIDHVLILEDKKIILDESVDSITDHLSFKLAMELSEIPNLIYSEGGLKGHAVVAKNQHQESSKMDMELFFNALQSEKEQILSIFNK